MNAFRRNGGQLLAILCLIAIPAAVSEPDKKENVTKIVLDNGCTMVNSNKSNASDMFFTMPYPFLNCSHLDKDGFDLTDVPNDTASMSFSYNRLKTFKIQDLDEFPKLMKLDLSHSAIEELVPSTSDPLRNTPAYFLFLAHNKLTDVPTEALKSFTNLRSLELSGNSIRTIKKDAFKYTPNLVHISLGSNPIEEISPKAWANLTEKLHMLSLHDDGLQEVPGFLANMSKLLFLSLTNNEIDEIKENSFSGAKALRWLELSGNAISTLYPRSFAGPNALNSLDLSDNDLESLPENVFSSMDDDGQMTLELFENPLECDCDLKWFKKWTNNIHSEDVRYKCQQPKRNHGKKGYELQESDFTCENTEAWEESCTDIQVGEPTSLPIQRPNTANNICPEGCTCYDSSGQQYQPKTSKPTQHTLRLPWHGKDIYPHVDCTGVKLTSFPTGVRKDVRTLTLAANNLGVLDLASLKPYTNLTKLDLRSSGLKALKNNSKTRLMSLTGLTIHHNSLSYLGPEHLLSFPNLNVLRMYNNQLKKIPTNLFKYTRKLNRLYMGANPVEKFDSNCLKGLNLYSLSLRNMSLTEVPTFFSKNLTYIELSDNRITKLSNNSFQNMGNLYRLSLDNNLISTIQVNAFKNTTKLRSLDLSENKISTLEERVFNDVNEERLRIELWMNRITCDCRMKWFKSWIEKLEAADPMTEIRFMCMMPLRLHGSTSDQLSPEVFVCNSDDLELTDEAAVETAFFESLHGHCYTRGQMALAVIMTIVFMLLIIIIAKFCNRRRKRGYAKYNSHHDSTTELDMNM